MNDYERVANSESSARLWALEAQVRQLAETDPAFLAAFERDPTSAVGQRFGKAALPNEGEHLEALPGGGFALVPRGPGDRSTLPGGTFQSHGGCAEAY